MGWSFGIFLIGGTVKVERKKGLHNCTNALFFAPVFNEYPQKTFLYFIAYRK
jgi:hypothetical protein